MKIIINKYLVPPMAVAWAFYPFIIMRSELYYKDPYIMHEQIHLAQQRELWILPFYIMYAGSYLFNLIRGDKNAYKNIVFEREAYANQLDNDYLKNRPKHAWRNFTIW
jgi:hypothetical protein